MDYVAAHPFKWSLLVLFGIWMFVFQPHFSAWRRRRYQERLADREARGTDAYFEELRELRAYPPERLSPAACRIIGALLLVLAALPFLDAYVRRVFGS